VAAEAEFLDGELNVKTGFFPYPGAMNALARHVMPWLLYKGERRLDCHGKLWGYAKRCRQCHERAPAYRPEMAAMSSDQLRSSGSVRKGLITLIPSKVWPA
jgi:hypothetical protein